MSDETFQRQTVDDATFLLVLKETLETLESAGIRFAALGGIASSVLGQPRWTKDIDLFVFTEDAERALDALAAAGYDTDRTNPQWIYKAVRSGVLVDLIFRSSGGFVMDEEMAARSREGSFRGQPVRVLAAEDIVVMKALVHTEETPRHWHDALGIIAVNDLDWDYLLERARHGPRRVLSLLIYAESSDLLVSERAIRALFDRVYATA